MHRTQLKIQQKLRGDCRVAIAEDRLKAVLADRSPAKVQKVRPDTNGGYCEALKNMKSLADIPQSVAHVDGWMVVRLQSGAEIRFLVAENPRLARGTPQQLDHVEISPFGLHWPDLDEDLSIRGLLEGNHGQFQKPAQV